MFVFSIITLLIGLFAIVSILFPDSPVIPLSILSAVLLVWLILIFVL